MISFAGDFRCPHTERQNAGAPKEGLGKEVIATFQEQLRDSVERKRKMEALSAPEAYGNGKDASGRRQRQQRRQPGKTEEEEFYPVFAWLMMDGRSNLTSVDTSSSAGFRTVHRKNIQKAGRSLRSGRAGPLQAAAVKYTGAVRCRNQCVMFQRMA